MHLLILFDRPRFVLDWSFGGHHTAMIADLPSNSMNPGKSTDFASLIADDLLIASEKIEEYERSRVRRAP
jgi:hypothetical protein